MKTIKTILACALCAVILASCQPKSKPLPGITQGAVDSVSTAVGVAFGNMLKSSNLEGLNYSKIVAAIKGVMAGDTTLIFDGQSAPMYIQDYMMKVTDALAVQKEEEEKKFFEENKKKEGVQETESGLQYKIEVAGSEVKPTERDTVEVNYKGMLLDGKVFDSSYERGETVKFPLNSVIKGWTEGLQLIGEGGKETLWIPFNMGYGSRDMGPNLPAFSTLVFDVELVKVFPYVEKEEKTKK
ncbi:MAG: FKBP-type peptidyl-prolyl cis-trans isomerase [Bacteroidales bacterium]|nr:FKBP-type peptidyl-prolyl cis-trans isomerase [Bacteroidales bacterium]